MRTVDEQFLTKSRPTIIVLTVLTMRLLDNWRSIVRKLTGEELGNDSTIILMAVIVIGAEKFVRGDLECELLDLTAAMPPGRLSSCNISSISAATDMNRETVRRKVCRLVDIGILQKEAGDGYRISPEFAARPEVRPAVRKQLEAVLRATRQMQTLGVMPAV